MGLADALFAGLGQGLNQGATNYVDGLQREQQMAIQRQQAANQQAQADREANTYQQQQAGLGLAGAQQGLLAAYQGGNYEQAAQYANQVPGLYQKANNITGVALPKPILGMPVAATPDLPVSFGGQAQAYTGQGDAKDAAGPIQGTNAQGGLTGLAAGAPQSVIQPGIPAHNDFGNAQTRAAIQANSMIQPQLLDLKNGDVKERYNAFTGEHTIIGSNQLHLDQEQQLKSLQDKLDYTLRGREEGYQAAAARQQFGEQEKDGRLGRSLDARASNAKAPTNWKGYAAVQPYDGIIQRAAALNGVDPDVLRAQLFHESGGNPNIRGAAGEYGLMQLMPETVQALKLTNPLDPEQNIMGGAKWLRMKIDQQGGDETKGITAYNGSGPAARQYAQTIRQLQGYYAKAPTPGAVHPVVLNGRKVILDAQGNTIKDLGSAKAPSLLDSLNNPTGGTPGGANDPIGAAILQALKDRPKAQGGKQ